MRNELHLLDLPKSSYHCQASRETRADRYAVERVHGRYGYRRIRAMLMREEGLCIGGKTVLRLMAEEGCRCEVRRRRYRSFKVDGEKVYLSPVIDLFNGEVVSHSVSRFPNMALVREMLEGAFPKLQKGDRPICHSDQGWQYHQPAYRSMLESHGIEQSMSRKGNCLDNAAAESFFGHLKEEFYRGRRFESVDSFTEELHGYIRWFNHDRIKPKLNGLSPVGYRARPTFGVQFSSGRVFSVAFGHQPRAIPR